MALIKRCLMCRKWLIGRKYDVINYKTSEGVRSAYICVRHTDDIVKESDSSESIRVRQRPEPDQEGPDTVVG